MVVLAIIGALIAVITPRMFSPNRHLKDEVRRISVMSKQLRDSARVQNATFRIVLDMRTEAGKLKHTYWVESSGSPVLLMTQEDREELESSLFTKDEAEASNASGFQKDDQLLKEVQELPRGLKFEKIEQSATGQEITEGRAYIHFFPSGLVEESALHISNGDKLQWTIYFHPLTGQASIYQEEIPLKNLRLQ